MDTGTHGYGSDKIRFPFLPYPRIRVISLSDPYLWNPVSMDTGTEDTGRIRSGFLFYPIHGYGSEAQGNPTRIHGRIQTIYPTRIHGN
jgi:hypothetical protein